jgi:hypothetical protein
VLRMMRVLPAVAAMAMLTSQLIAAPSVGSKAPELSAKELNGKPFRLSQFRGRSPVVVNFFSTT